MEENAIHHAIHHPLYKGDAFIVDQKTTNGAVSIQYVLPGDEGEMRRIRTNNNAHIDRGAEGEVEVEYVAASGNNLHATTIVYDRTTMLFESDPTMFSSLQAHFTEHPDIEHLIAVRSVNHGFLCTLPDRVELDYEKINAKDITASEAKDDLKVYETPSNVIQAMLSSLDETYFNKIAFAQVAEKIREIIAKDTTYSLHIDKVIGMGAASQAKDLMADYLVYRVINPSKADKIYEEENDEGNKYKDLLDYAQTTIVEDEKIATILDFLGKVKIEGEKEGYREAMKEYAVEWKEITGKKVSLKTVPVFDPQAGSGDGMLKAFDEAHFDGALRGTELRHIDVEDDRYGVMQGVNTALYGPAYKEVFRSKKYETGAQNLLTYLNPPYTNGNALEKETVKLLSSGMLTTGLFPTSMQNFFHNNLSGDSLILSIPRDVTGYTDPRTPERFLFVLGTRHDPDQMEDNGRLRSYPTSRELSSSTTIDLFRQNLLVHIEQNPKLGKKIEEMFKYYDAGSPDRLDMVTNQIHKRIDETMTFYANIEKIESAIVETLPMIIENNSPIAMASKKPVFRDPTIYNKEGNYPRLGFMDVINNIPLLVFYRDNMPSMFNLVEKVAQSLDVEMPVDADKQKKPYSFYMDKNEIQKTTVTSMALGMMRLFFYPSSVSLKSEDEKGVLLALIDEYTTMKDIPFDREKREYIKGTIDDASTMVLKNTKIVSAETGLITPKEYFVLLDDFGFDVGKLEFELGDFYEMLEQKGLFELEDYIELASLTVSDKEMLMREFVDRMDGTYGIIAQVLGRDKDELKQEMYSAGKKLLMQKQRGELSQEEMAQRLIELKEEYGITEALKNTLIMDSSSILQELKKALSNIEIDPNTIKKGAERILENFRAAPITYFQEDILADLNVIGNALFDRASKYTTEEERDDYIEDFISFQNAVMETLSPLYNKYKSLAMSSGRLSEILFTRVPLLAHFLDGKDVKEDLVETLYEKNFRPIFLKTLGLREHQFTEAERFLAMSDENKTEQLSWMMRVGKTLTFISISYLLSLKHKEDFSLLLETANMNDISQQMFEAYPFLALSSRYYVSPKSIDVNPDMVLTNMTTNEMVPRLFKLFPQKNFLGGGSGVSVKNATYGRDIEANITTLEEKFGGEFTKEHLNQLAKEFADSPFVEILNAGRC